MTTTTSTTKNLNGKVALVTGGAKRVGKETALILARHGMDVAITYNHSSKEAESTTQAIRDYGRQAIAIQTDLAHPGAPQQVFNEFTKHFNQLDALINNAAIFEPTPLASLTTRDFDRFIAINTRAPLMLTTQFADFLTTPHPEDTDPITGSIVNIIDTHVLGQPLPNHAAYNASKAALLEITMTCAVEMAPNVTVNAIAPGVVAWAPSYTPQEQQAYLNRVPLNRPGTPHHVASAALYLIRHATYTTGQVLKLDGGRHLT